MLLLSHILNTLQAEVPASSQQQLRSFQSGSYGPGEPLWLVVRDEDNTIHVSLNLFRRGLLTRNFQSKLGSAVAFSEPWRNGDHDVLLLGHSLADCVWHIQLSTWLPEASDPGGNQPKRARSQVLRSHGAFLKQELVRGARHVAYA